MQSFLNAIPGSSFGTPVFDRGIRLNFCVNCSANSNGVPATVGTAKGSNVDVPDSSTLLATLHRHELPRTFAADLVVIRAVNVKGNFASLTYLCLSQRGEESKIPPTHGNIPPSGYYAWDTQAIILQSLVFASSKDVPSPAHVEVEVRELAKALNNGASVTTEMVVRVTKFDVDHYRHQGMLLWVNKIKDLEVLLCDIDNAHVLSLAQSFRAVGFENTRATLSVTITVMANRFETCEGAPWDSHHIPVGATFVFLFNERHWLQALYDLQKAANIAWTEASLLVRCVVQYDGHPVVEKEALKLCGLANKLSSIIRRDSSFAAVVKSVTDLSTALEKEHDMFFLAAQMVDILDDMDLFNFLTGNSCQTCLRYIRVAKFFFQRNDMFNIIENIGEKETGVRAPGIPHIDNRILFS